jgi:hypothetical protein
LFNLTELKLNFLCFVGAFMGRGEAAVASNIVNQTHRIQSWDLFINPVPDLSDGMNILKLWTRD